MLSQLSYAPSITNVRLRSPRRLLHRLTPFGSEMLVSAKALTIIAMVGLVGFEPTTPALSRRCSNRLSYRPLSLSIFTVDKREHLSFERSLEKGGDPAAPSDTATLLRLHPSHESYRGDRPPCG